MKYVNYEITFSEIPDEISLCINISNCPNNCTNCHSSYLKKDIGTELTYEILQNLINENKGITCVCFMGGDKTPEDVLSLARFIRETCDNIKIGWYSGRNELPTCIELNLQNFDYIKLGAYIEEKGPLNNPNTNQKMYEICRISKLPEKFICNDITYKFWKT
jgi:anaerobic ribonucleoside-triphosphate reductase activating protein